MALVQIPNPCSEDWQLMRPQKNGRHCDSCCKVVVDFTTMSNLEIVNYLQEKSAERVCGRFRNDQVQQPAVIPVVLTRNHLRRIHVFAAALYIVFGAALFTSCTNTTVGKIVHQQADNKNLTTQPDAIINSSVPASNQQSISNSNNLTGDPSIKGEIDINYSGSQSTSSTNHYITGDSIVPTVIDTSKNINCRGNPKSIEITMGKIITVGQAVISIPEDSLQVKKDSLLPETQSAERTHYIKGRVQPPK